MKALLTTLALLLVWTAAARADDGLVDGKLNYRGFVVDVREAEGLSNFDAVVDSMKHQIDIVADCGARDDVMAFFHVPPIIMRRHPDLPPGEWRAGIGAEIETIVLEPQKPILLHELLHAYHFRVLPDGFHNADVERFYTAAKDGDLYPSGAYLMRNSHEFFAVTASLYLWGNVDRPPHNRETLKAAQPEYYAWLGQVFGVQK